MKKEKKYIGRILMNVEGREQLVELREKPIYEIENCPIGSIISLGIEWCGYYAGMDGDDITMRPIKGKGGRMGFNINAFNSYFEEVIDEK